MVVFVRGVFNSGVNTLTATPFRRFPGERGFDLTRLETTACSVGHKLEVKVAQQQLTKHCGLSA